MGILIDRERPGSTGLDAATERRVIEQHLRAHADRYCGRPPERPDVALLRLRSRAAARLYWYRVGAGGGSRTVVVKVPGGPADSGVGGQAARPRMTAPPPIETKYAREHQALGLVERHFADLDDPRFGAVPVLDRIEGARAIVMGEVEGRSLNELLPRLSRIHPGGPGPLLERAVANAGAWLREYHGLEIEGALPRSATRADFLENVRRFCAHLGPLVSRPDFLADLSDRLEAAANRLLPAELPLGLGHGDFAMRNVLVAPDGRVVVLDTTAFWRTPVYADLAKLGVAIRLSRVQLYSRGWAFSDDAVRRAERWLLAGYYGGDPVPERQIRLYGLLLLLDKWSFELALAGPGGMLATARRRLLDSWYARQALALARDVT